MTSSRGGFSLIEVLVGITVAAVAIATAAGILGAITDSLLSLTSESIDREWRAQGRFALDEALASVEVTPDSGRAFKGDPRQMSFFTEVWVAEGWQESRRVLVSIVDSMLVIERDGQALAAVEKIRPVRGGVFEYAARSAAGSLWSQRWESFVASPAAVRLVADNPDEGRDTLLLLVGPN